MNEQILRYSAVDGVGRIHFNNPKALNALSLEMAQAFRSASKALTDDPSLRVIVLSAAGRSFMAGGDLRYFRDSDDKPGAARTLISAVNEALNALHRSDKIVIAAIQGAVAGGGIGIALSADFVISADDVAFTTAYGRLGATLDCGGSRALTRRAGYSKAIELALLPEALPVGDALKYGLVNRIVPRAALEVETETLVSTLLSGARLAQRNVKALLRKAEVSSFDEQLQAEIESFVECAASRDFAEGLSAFFEKRPARFEGDKP